jgi:hypothetical protein
VQYHSNVWASRQNARHEGPFLEYIFFDKTYEDIHAGCEQCQLNGPGSSIQTKIGTIGFNVLSFDPSPFPRESSVLPWGELSISGCGMAVGRGNRRR